MVHYVFYDGAYKLKVVIFSFILPFSPSLSLSSIAHGKKCVLFFFLLSLLHGCEYKSYGRQGCWSMSTEDELYTEKKAFVFDKSPMKELLSKSIYLG